MLYNEMNRDVAHTRMIGRRKSDGRGNGRDSLGTILAFAFAYGLWAFIVAGIALLCWMDFDCPYEASADWQAGFVLVMLVGAPLFVLRIYRHKKPAGICGNIGMVLLSMTSIAAGCMLFDVVATHNIAAFSLVRWSKFILIALVMIIPLSYWAELIYKAIQNARGHHVASSLNIA